MPFERAMSSKGEIREMVLSWQINDAVNLALKNPELQFHALMTLDALTIWGERPEIDKNVFIPILMGLLEVRDEEIRKIAARIMERFKAA